MLDTMCGIANIMAIGDTLFASAGGPSECFDCPAAGMVGRTTALDPYGNVLWTTTDYHLYNYRFAMVYHSGELWLKTNATPYDTISVLNAADGVFKYKRAVPYCTEGLAFMGDRFYSRSLGVPPMDYDLKTGAPLQTPFRLFQGENQLTNACSPVVAANGYLYAGFGSGGSLTRPTQDNQYYAWDAATGAPVWRFPNSSHTCNEVTIAYDKLYMVTLADGLIYCFENDQ
jgi:outer membrane protein assembly factor BamB